MIYNHKAFSCLENNEYIIIIIKEFKVKKSLKLLGCILCAAMLFSCNTSTNDEGGGSSNSSSVETKSLTEQIDAAASKGVIDFSNKKITEDASVDDKITIKNLDMGGKTLTVYAAGVELENVSNATVIVADGDVKLKNCKNIKKLEVQKTASGSLEIDASQIETIEVTKDGVRIVLKDKETKITEVVLSAKNTIVETESEKTTSEAPQINTITVGKDAENVSISGGVIDKIDVKTETGGTTPTVTLTGETEIKEIKGTETVNVTEEAKDSVKVPEGITKEEITEIGRDFASTANIKRVYTVGDAFDYSNLCIKVSYSNGSSKNIPLTNSNCIITGFDSSKAGTCEISIIYEGSKVTSYTVTIRNQALADNSTANQYIEAAVELLSVGQPDIDGAIKYFRKAYETEKTDETKLYYALAEVASISTDENIVKLLKENFGFEKYPATINALFTNEWLKDYIDTKPIRFTDFEKDTTGSYIRGNRVKTSQTNAKNSLFFFRPAYYLDEDGDWMYSETSSYLYEIEPAANGSELFGIYENYDYLNTSSGSSGQSEASNDTVDNYIDDKLDKDTVTNIIREAINNYKEINKDYLYSSTNSYKMKRIPTNNKAVGPDFKVLDADNKDYQSTLYKSMQTAETISYLMVMNFFSCNATGFNSLVDNTLNVFDTRYENAKKLISDIKQESIVVPSDIIKALHLEEQMGSNTVKIGKAEIDVFFAATDIIKGLFQWFSSYDLSMDINILPEKISTYKKGDGQITNNIDRLMYAHSEADIYNNWFQATQQYFIPVNYNDPWMKEYQQTENEKLFARWGETLPLLSNASTLKIRNASAMTASKNTVVNALKKALASYKYITEDSKTYPSAIRDMIKQGSGTIYEAVESIVKGIEDDTTATFGPNTKNGSWEITMDFGKVFTPGYFTDLFEKDSNGNLKVYVYQYTADIDVLEKVEGNNRTYSRTQKTVSLDSPVLYSDDASLKSLVAADEGEIPSASFGGYIKINTKLIADLIPSMAKAIPEESKLPVTKLIKFSPSIPSKTE